MYRPRLHLRENGMLALGSTPIQLRKYIKPFVQAVHTKKIDLSPKSPTQVDLVVSEVCRLLRLGIEGETLFESGQPFYFGMGQLKANVRTSNRAHPIEATAADLRTTGHVMTPVVRVDSSLPYIMANKAITEIDGRGCCIRIQKSDLLSLRPFENLARLTHILGLQPSQIDLLIDFGYINWPISDVVTHILNTPRLHDWRTVIFAAGSMPESLAMFGRPGEYFRHAYEEETFRIIQDSADRIGREIEFSDYTTRHPRYQFASEGFSPSPSVRYPTSDGWMILKGKKFKLGTGKTQHEQMLEHAFRIRNASFFPGAEFSPGDNFVDQIVSGKKKPGDMNGWLRSEISRHICLKTVPYLQDAVDEEDTA